MTEAFLALAVLAAGLLLSSYRRAGSRLVLRREMAIVGGVLLSASLLGIWFVLPA